MWLVFPGGDSRPHTLSPFHLCLSQTLVAIKLFQPKSKVTIILVCVLLTQREAPFPAVGKVPPRPGRCPGWRAWAQLVFRQNAGPRRLDS